LSLSLRIAPLVFMAAVVQVATISGVHLLGAELDVLLVTVVVVALLAGSVAGAATGFAGGLLVDVMTLGTLGQTSIVLILAGYWAGRYGETTGRDRRHAVPLAAFAISLLATLGAVALHVLLGEPVSARTALTALLPSAVLAAILALPAHRLARFVLSDSAPLVRPPRIEIV